MILTREYGAKGFGADYAAGEPPYGFAFLNWHFLWVAGHGTICLSLLTGILTNRWVYLQQNFPQSGGGTPPVTFATLLRTFSIHLFFCNGEDILPMNSRTVRYPPQLDDLFHYWSVSSPISRLTRQTLIVALQNIFTRRGSENLFFGVIL